METLKIKLLKGLLVFSMLSPVSFLFAQRSTVDIGIEGGIGRSTLRGNDVIDHFYDPKFGPTGGIFAQYNMKKIFSVRLGCYYQDKGSSFKADVTDASGNKSGTVRGSQDFNYITIPLLLRAGFGDRVASVFFNAGPYVDLLLKQTEQMGRIGEYPATSTDRTGNFKKTDLGISFGIGVSYPLFHYIAVSLEVRNYLGLTNVSNRTIYNNGSIKNNSLNCLVGITYRFIEKS